MQELPDLPSQLIRLALSDLEKCEADPHYTICMAIFHGPLDDGTCAVCLAGAVMSQTLQCDRSRQVDPYYLGAEVSCKLRALDAFRLGDIDQGLAHLDLDEHPEIPTHMPVTRYPRDPEMFKADMLTMARLLETYGL